SGRHAAALGEGPGWTPNRTDGELKRAGVGPPRSRFAGGFRGWRPPVHCPPGLLQLRISVRGRVAEHHRY
ncbi:unnamed protein product, partial [Polarella glacialis]